MSHATVSPNHIILFIMFFYLSIDSALCSASTSCPIDLSYVETVPWNTSQCRNGDDTLCCQTLLSLFGIGIAQHLKDASLFQLPDSVSSSACLNELQTRLSAVSVRPSLVPFCFHNSTQFVANNSSCAGIVTTQDWVQKVGTNGLLEASCKGDLTGLTRCSSCLDAGLKVTSELKSLDMNETKCFYFTVLYAAGVVNEFGPKDARTAACIFGLPLSGASAGRFSGRKALVLKLMFVIIGVMVGVLAAFILLILYKSWNKQRKQDSDRDHQEFVTSFRARVMPNSGGKWFKLNELERATNGFSPKNLVGQGTYGVVYKGLLADGTLIAVKQLLDLEATCDEDFTNEVEIISKIRHRNLLPLRGCCIASDNSNGKRRFLVYDYMSRGNLSENLAFKYGTKKRLTWPQRKSIVLDVAKGLAYLHYGIKPSIFHRDIKATNVLLDAEMNAKVADFGLAKQTVEGQTHMTTRVAGTYGYLAPEYALYGQLTEKSDVYSFGILILEIMSGKKVLETSNESAILITDWVWKLVKLKRIDQVFEEGVREEGPKGVMERFVLVGVLCAHAMVAFRPTIADAVKMLEGDIDIPEIPDRPMPLSHESFRASLERNGALGFQIPHTLSSREMRAPVINPDDVHRYIEKVKNGIEHCIKEYMNEEQTIDYLCRVAKIPPHITSMMWKCLQESNPEFFNEYFMRLQLVRQIKTFNGLLNKQVQILQLVKNPPPPPFYNPNIHNWQPWSSPFDKPFPRSNDGQRMMFPGTVCNSGIASSYDFKVSVAPNIGIVPPQDNSPPFPFYPANGSSYTGSNINALPNFMVPVPNSYPSLGPSNNGRFMRQNSPPALSSSTFPVNGNMPQLPTMHDSSLFPASSYQVGDSCMSLLQEHTSSNSDIDSPMNTEDENDSVTQPVTGGPTVDDGTGSSPSV